MKFTETIGAEDFAEDLSFIMEKYNLPKDVMIDILQDMIDLLKYEDEE